MTLVSEVKVVFTKTNDSSGNILDADIYKTAHINKKQHLRSQYLSDYIFE